MNYRYFPSFSFPTYRFQPGQNVHPGLAEPELLPIDPASPEASEGLRIALDLHNHAYYWEAHVYLESLWKVHGKTGAIADFLKAWIKIEAAGVKLRGNQREAAKTHLLRSAELLDGVMKVEGFFFLGFDLKILLKNIERVSEGESEMFLLEPTWK